MAIKFKPLRCDPGVWYEEVPGTRPQVSVQAQKSKDLRFNSQALFKDKTNYL